VILALAEPKSAEEMAIKVGIDKEHLQPFLEAMVREKSIILDNNRYIMNK
jgi:predicted transcriptional regulator